ncbi:MAG: ATP-dependent DNA helicase RecG, partial [Bacteroidota bacterium]
METMVRTNNGFEIAETDLKLRGPGDLMGTQQSGVVDLHIADLARDADMLQVARAAARELLQSDPELVKPDNAPVRRRLEAGKAQRVNWSRIS